jgi:hypothetical protein
MVRFRRLRLSRAPALLAWCACWLALASGCGRPATVEDCERIVVRMAQLELRANHITDPRQIELQVAATKNSFEERAMQECVGRHISDSAMECISNANTTEEVLGECLD